METRELFSGFTSNEILFFYIIGLSAVSICLVGFWFHVAKYLRGSRLRTSVDFMTSAKKMIVDLMSHRTLKRRDTYAGVAHAAIFFGFGIAFIGTSIVTLEYDILEPLFGITFWKGNFYLLFSLVVDLGGLALICGIVLMMVRRAYFKLGKLEYIRLYRGESKHRSSAKKWKIEDWVFLSLLLLIAVTGFLQEGLRLMIERPDWAAWSPVGLLVAGFLEGLDYSQDNAAVLRAINWWFHGIIALAFIGVIPWFKAKHIVTAIGSLSVRDPMALKRLPFVDITDEPQEDDVGISRIEQFDWKQMLHFDACTKCGRCHDVCPARNSGYVLSPRDLILDLRLYNDEVQGRSSNEKALIGDVIAKETLWSCRTCGACQEICPVGIEHPTLIVEMRRHLIAQGDMDPLLQTTLGTIADKGNSFGESPKKRPNWTKTLDFEIKDIRKETAEYLWFVGDFAAFDPRNQIVSQTFAKLLKAAGVDFGLLHEGERNAGNDVRRIGEEGLYESLAQHNIEQFKGAERFKSIITTDPHSYNTIKNEYPELGSVSLIDHYSTVLADLLESGKLKVVNPLNKRVTFHDPCHLGRLNGGYDGPRRVLAAIGCELVEMPRNRDNSFCCGAGGGRIWIPDDPGTEKPSENRMHEAAALGNIDYFITSCPKDLTMYEDARKTSGHEDAFVVKDIAELVAEAIQLERLSLTDVPQLVEKIANAVAEKVVASIENRVELLSLQSVNESVISESSEQKNDSPSLLVSEVKPDKSDGTNILIETEKTTFDEPVTLAVKPREIIRTKIMSAVWNKSPVKAAELPAYDLPPKDKCRIVVAVKHVGRILDTFDIADYEDDVRGEYLEGEFNEFDDNALEAALRLGEKLGVEGERGAEIVVVCVGPDEAEVTLRKALAKGADRGVRVWDDGLIGADPIAIARLLAGACQHEMPDIVFAGVQSSDKTNGATGTALARILDLPSASVVVDVDWDGGERMILTRELEGGVLEKFEFPSKSILTIQTGAFEPRYATMRMIKQAKKKPIAIIDSSGQSNEQAGYVISRMFKPPVQKAEMLEGDMTTIANKIKEIIKVKVGS